MLLATAKHVLTVVKWHFYWCMQVCIDKQLRYGVAYDLYSNFKISKPHLCLKMGTMSIVA